MWYTSLAMMLAPFTLHCTEGHGSAVTTANSTTDLPLPVATNTGFPMSLLLGHHRRRLSLQALLMGREAGKAGIVCVCVCVTP